MINIFSFLNAQDLRRVSQTCRLWNLLAQDNTLWEHLVRKKWAIDPRDTIVNWRKAYQAKLVYIIYCILCCCIFFSKWKTFLLIRKFLHQKQIKMEQEHLYLRMETFMKGIGTITNATGLDE